MFFYSYTRLLFFLRKVNLSILQLPICRAAAPDLISYIIAYKTGIYNHYPTIDLKRIPHPFSYIFYFCMKGVFNMTKKEFFNAILLSLSLTYVVTKVVANFDSIDEVHLIEDLNNKDFPNSS